MSQPRKHSLGWAKLLSFFLRQVLAGRAQYGVHIPCMGRDSSQQQTGVKVPAIAYFQHRLANVVGSLDPRRCRGLPAWGEGARTRHRPVQGMQSCHSDAVHGISTPSTPSPWSDVCDRNLKIMASELNSIWHFSGALSVGLG